MANRTFPSTRLSPLSRQLPHSTSTNSDPSCIGTSLPLRCLVLDKCTHRTYDRLLSLVSSKLQFLGDSQPKPFSQTSFYRTDISKGKGNHLDTHPDSGQLAHATSPPYLRSLTIATEDPTHMSDTHQIYFLNRICLLIIPHPIASNPHSLFLLSAATELRTLRQAQNGSIAFMTKICYTTPTAQMKPRAINDLTSIAGKETALKKSLEIPHREYSNRFPSPQNSNVGLARNETIVTHSAQIQLLHTTQAQKQTTKFIASPGSPPNTDLIAAHTPQITQRSNPLSLMGYNGNLLDPHPLVCTSDPLPFDGALQDKADNSDTPPQTYSEDTPENNTVQNVATHSSRQKTKSKGKQIATRRSQRLREKEMPECNSTKLSKSAKTKMANIPFQLCSHEIPLEIEVALKLLHESGLQVDQKIQDMVQEASKLDLVNTTSNDSSPSTPLHDHIPPLMLPGENFLL